MVAPSYVLSVKEDDTSNEDTAGAMGAWVHACIPTST